MLEPKIAEIIDIQVGERIRLRRKLLGLSQTALADKIGVTFQQVQKYEKGSNRVGSSRLHRIALVLGLDPSALFGETAAEDSGSSDSIDRSLMEFAVSAESLGLNRAFLKIKNTATRRCIIALVKALAASGDVVADGSTAS
jgi:transcriptional regulator with XRE-family HTH domain